MTAPTSTPAVAGGEAGAAGVNPEKPTVDLPETAANWIALIKSCDAAIADLEERKAVARAQLEQLLGEHEVGRLNGAPAVHWTFVTSRRLDQRKIKAEAPDLVARCTVETVSRRFTLAKDET